MTKLIFLLFLLPVTTCMFAQSDTLPAYDARLTGFDYPFLTDTLRFTSQRQALEMVYMDITPLKPSGHTAVLLHGKNFNGAYWEQTARLLLDLGYRVIIPDQIGFGKSSKPDHYQFTFQQLATNTAGLLDHLGVTDSVQLFGHSMGGMLATRFALLFPERVERLILVNPIGLEDWKLKVPYQPIGWWYDNELQKDYAAIKKYQQSNYYDGNWDPAYDRWVAPLAGWAKHPDYERVAWNAALTYDMIFTQPVVYEFEQLTVPTLLIIGTRDRTALGKPLVPEDVRATMGRYDQLGKMTRDRIPDATLVELDGLGHLPQIENFPRFRKVLLAEMPR